MSLAKKEKISVGERVQWQWMGRTIAGTVKEIYYEAVLKKIKNKAIKRNGTKENPAYLVESEAGNVALKLQSELQLAAKENTKSAKPRMFGN